MSNKIQDGESGNIFTVLIGAVALVGVVSIASMNMLSGPVATSAKVMNKTMADSQMFANNKIVVLSATNQANSGDCDSDTYIEPSPWRNASGNGPDGVTGSQGGGFLPSNLGLSTVDPWGTEYGYCVWDVGTVDDAGCGGAAQLRLAGSPDPSAGNADTQYVQALISAGPDRIFQTQCKDYVDTTTAILTAGGDDIVQTYTYSEASAAGTGLWDIQAGNVAVATIDKAIKFADQTATITCDANSVNAMRYNDITNTIQKCDGAAGTWSDIGSGGGGAFSLNTGVTPNVVYNNGDQTSDDFVFGSPQLADDGNAAHDARMFFDKSKGAFRAGGATSTQWNDTAVGINSFATGLDNIASGSYSVAMGRSNSVGGSYSVAMGRSNSVGGEYSTATGTFNIVSSAGNFSFAAGATNYLMSNYTVAFGTNNTLVADLAIALGQANMASGANSIALGQSNLASGANSIALGQSNRTGGANSIALGQEASVTATGINSFAFGLGDASSSAYPQVSGANSLGIFMGDQSGVDVSANNTMAILGGNLAVGATATTAGYKLDVIGNLRVQGSSTTCTIGDGTGATNCTSDARLKKDIVRIPNALDKISRLNGVTFKWKDKNKDKNTHIGVIAQNIEKTFPEIVTEMPDGMKAVDYAALVSPLIEATKELKTKNEKLEREVTALKNDIEKLKTYTGYKHDKASMNNLFIFSFMGALFAIFGFSILRKRTNQ